jgi:hypothetical protein
MPSSVASLFAAAGLEPEGAVVWGTKVTESRSGVYTVALTGNPDDAVPAPIRTAPISPFAVEALLTARPELKLDGARPTAALLSARLAEFWFPDEPVLYIGRAGTSTRPRALGKRIGEYYTTPLGAKGPHAGGWFLKSILSLNELFVHYATAADPEDAESRMTRAFCRGVSRDALAVVRNPDRPFPFANLEWPRGVRKNHGITGARGA